MDGDGPCKTLRKPYTITKSRDRWSEEEHERFLDGLLLFGREWKKIEDFVGTKTAIQVCYCGLLEPPGNTLATPTNLRSFCLFILILRVLVAWPLGQRRHQMRQVEEQIRQKARAPKIC